MQTRESFLSATLPNISQVYNGKRHHCRCGCGGTYTATTFMEKPRTDIIDNRLVERRLKRAKKLVEAGVDVDYGTNYVDVQTGRNRALTFYFDELKK